MRALTRQICLIRDWVVREDTPTVSADGRTVRMQEARHQSAPLNYAAIRKRADLLDNFKEGHIR